MTNTSLSFSYLPHSSLAAAGSTPSRTSSSVPSVPGVNPASPAFPWPSGQINRIAAYCRVSLEVEHTGSHTFQTQQQEIESWALGRYGIGNYTIQWFSDNGISGAVGSHAGHVQGRTGKRMRPGLQACRRLLQSGGADTLVVYSLSRLGRNTSLVLDIVENDIVVRGLGFRAIAEGDSTDPYTMSGKLVLTVLASTHTYQREETRERCRASKETAHQAGYITGKPCFGWRLGQEVPLAQETPSAPEAPAPPSNSRKEEQEYRQDGELHSTLPVGTAPPSTDIAPPMSYGKARPRLFPIPEQAKLLRQMQEWFLSGWALNRIVQELNDRAVPTPSGLPHWHVTTVRRILFNPLHAGLVKMKGDLRQGEHFERRLFEPEEHQELLRLYKQRCKTLPTNTGRSSNTYSLTGLVKCGHCGSRLYVASPQTRSSVALKCHKRELHRSQSWPMVRVYLGTVEEFVEGQVKALVESPLMQEALNIAAGQALGQEQERLLGEQNRLQELLKNKALQTHRLLNLYTSDALDLSSFQEQQTLIQAERDAAALVLEEVEVALSNRTSQQHQHARLRQALLCFNQVWPHLDANERRAVLELLIEKLEVWKEGEHTFARLKLHLFPEVEAELVRAPRASKMWKRHPEGPGGVQRLTPRQLALLHWHARGLSLPEAAAQMVITLSTVRTLVSEIRHLLQVQELDEAVALAQPRLKAELATLPLGVARNHGDKELLSAGELQVLHFLALSAKPAEIAQETGLSINTIRNYQGQIYKALGAHSAYQAVKRARELKLLD